MSKRILCKFFAHGACLKGEHCEYAHDWKAPPNNICTFYQRGACAYGSRCRYDHVKISRSQPCTSSSSTSSWGRPVSGASIPPTAPVVSDPAELSATATPIPPPSKPAWDQQSGNLDVSDNNGTMEYKSDNLADQAICSFAAAGSCPRGEICPHVHGDLCSICGKHCLHPFRLEEREEHTTVCEKRQKHLEVLRQSQEIECSVCLERVLSKPTTAERKFGLLSECDHPFCITCIRNWRNCSPSSSMDVNSTLRACPICRKLSYFVIPSVIWYFSKAEKQEIVDSYKAKLKSIDCKYFDFGNGTCPFGTSCFYKHIVKPGLCCKRNFNPSTSSMPHRRSSLYDDDTLHYTDLDTFFTLLDAEDLVCEALASEMAFLQEFEELEKKYSGDYDEEDFLTPWQRSFLWSQLGYDRDEFDYWSDGDFDDSDDNDDS